MTATEYVQKKQRLIYTPFVIDVNGIGWYIVKGQRVDKKTFERENVLPMSLIEYNSDNSDRTKDWLRA